MSDKILEKALQDRQRGAFDRALERLTEGIREHPRDGVLYKEAIDTALEAGESRRSAQFFKSAWKRLPGDRKDLWTTALEKLSKYSDAVLAQCMIDVAVKDRNFDGVEDTLAALKDHTVTQLLERARTKKKTLSTALSGGMSTPEALLENAIGDALLCLRAGLTKEAGHAIEEILSEHEGENEVFLPFLMRLEKRDRDNADFAFVIGCSLLRAQHWGKAIDHLVRSASLDGEYATEAIARIQSLAAIEDVSVADLDTALARIHLRSGDVRNAAACIGRALSVDPGKAGEIMAMLEPFIEDVGDDLLLHYLFIETALKGKRTDRGITCLRRIYGERRHRADLFAWLDERAREGRLPIDALNYFGEIALSQEMFEKAVEAFREVIAEAPHEVVRIRDAITRFRRDPAIRKFYDEISKSEHVDDDDGGGFEIKHYETRDFSFGGEPQQEAAPEPAAPEPAAPEPAAPEPARADAGITPMETPFAPDANAAPSDPAAEELADPEVEPEGLENGDDEEGVSFSLGETTGEDALGDGFSIESERATPFSGMPAEPNHGEEEWLSRGRPGPPPPETTQAPAGDPEWLHRGAPGPPSQPAHDTHDSANTQIEEPSDPAPNEASDFVSYETEVVPESGPEEPQADEPEEESYDSLVRRFEAGELKGSDALRLAAMARVSGDLEAFRRFLQFDPENVAQEITRKQCLSEYYIRIDQPLSALIILKTIRLGALGKEQRRAVLLLIAYSYRMLHRFDAAQSTYLRLLAEDASVETAERMAKVNYQDYLKDVAGLPPVLEKVLTL